MQVRYRTGLIAAIDRMLAFFGIRRGPIRLQVHIDGPVVELGFQLGFEQSRTDAKAGPRLDRTVLEKLLSWPNLWLGPISDFGV